MGIVESTAITYKYRAEYSSYNVIYEGWALPGIATSVARWKICKHTYSGTNLTQTDWADGNKNFDNVWDDRGTLSYS